MCTSLTVPCGLVVEDSETRSGGRPMLVSERITCSALRCVALLASAKRFNAAGDMFEELGVVYALCREGGDDWRIKKLWAWDDPAKPPARRRSAEAADKRRRRLRPYA